VNRGRLLRHSRTINSHPEEKTVVLFIEKTWFLWWMLAIFLALRWLHVVSAAAKKMEGPDALALELALEEEQDYIVSWRILHKAHPISIFQTKRVH
jgi:hypothetical protein